MLSKYSKFYFKNPSVVQIMLNFLKNLIYFSISLHYRISLSFSLRKIMQNCQHCSNKKKTKNMLNSSFFYLFSFLPPSSASCYSSDSHTHRHAFILSRVKYVESLCVRVCITDQAMLLIKKEKQQKPKYISCFCFFLSFISCL